MHKDEEGKFTDAEGENVSRRLDELWDCMHKASDYWGGGGVKDSRGRANWLQATLL